MCVKRQVECPAGCLTHPRYFFEFPATLAGFKCALTSDIYAALDSLAPSFGRTKQQISPPAAGVALDSINSFEDETREALWALEIQFPYLFADAAEDAGPGLANCPR